MKYLFYPLILLVLFNSCKRNPIADEPTNKPPASQFKINNIIPSTALAGDVIKIIGTDFDSTYWKNRVFINGLQSIVDSGNNGNLFTRVPFRATTGNISIIKYEYVGYQSGVPIDSIIGPIMTIIPVDTTKFNLLHYSGTPLTEAQSLIPGDQNGTYKWSASINGDTVLIIQHYPFGDEGSCEEKFWFFQTSTDSVPQSVSGYVEVKILESYYSFTSKGIVAIQEWNLNNKIIGRISICDESNSWSDFVFWYSFK